jgi:hypothetical protein
VSGPRQQRTQGVPSSTLAWTFTSLASTTDDLDFSNDGGATWTYTPTGTWDANVTHVRLRPKGRMAGSNGSANPYFELRFRVRLK